MLRQLLSSGGETPRLRRSPRVASRRLMSTASSSHAASPPVLGKRLGASLTPTSDKRPRQSFDINAATESVVVKMSDDLNLSWYRDVASSLVVVVTPKVIHSCDPVGEFPRVRLVLRSTGSYCIQV